MGLRSIAKGIVKAVISPVKIVTSIFKMNPKLAILAIAATWLFGSLLRKQDNPDFGDTEFDNFEKGILINKQSNDATIPVVYGERLIGGTRCFIETSGTDNNHLYIALVLCEGEINAITEIQVNDDAVTFSGSFADGTRTAIANYTPLATLFTIDSAYNGLYASGQVDVTALDIQIPQNTNIAVVGTETGTVTPNNGELAISFRFKEL